MLLKDLQHFLPASVFSVVQHFMMVPASDGKVLFDPPAALASLGYSQSEIGMALKGIDVENLPVEEIVRRGLRAMVMQ